MVNMRHVFSSHIDRIGYDPASGKLRVEYNTGKVAVYQGVPPGVASNVTGAVSIGKAMHEHVRGKFPVSYEGEASP